MRKLISLIATMAGVLTVALMGTPAVAADLPNPLGLRGFNLGMTLDELRRLKFPDPTTDDVRLICTGDELSGEAGLGSEVDDIGVKLCGFFAVAKGKVRNMPMIVGGPEARVTFAITPNFFDTTISKRLFDIYVVVKSEHFADLETAYTAKFGPPHARRRPPDRGMSWRSKHANLTFLDRVDGLNILYTDTELNWIVDAMKKTKGKPGADKL